MAFNSACASVGQHIALHRGPAPVPVGPCERWSMDFEHDTLADGRPFRILTVVDNWSRHSPVLEAGVRMSGAGRRAGDVLDHRRISTPGAGRLGISALIQFDFIRPGKSVGNAFIESSNGRLRDECLSVNQFASLAEAQFVIEAWPRDYNSVGLIALSGN